MILVVDLCRADLRLSRYEFVDPIVSALSKAGACTKVAHYTHANIDSSCNGVILCGTALKDGEYLENLEAFSWLELQDVPVLGICAGMQVISALSGGSVVPAPEVGLKNIDIVADSPLLGPPRTIQGYHLHTFASQLPKEFSLLAGSASCVEAFSSNDKKTYGILFHPEVRNTWILENFARICGEL